MGKYIDTSKVTVPKDFFNNLNVPKLLDWLNSQPPADVVSKGVFEQVMWERDTAIDQLESYGVGFAEIADVARVVRCKDCVHCAVREYDIIDELECEFFDIFTDPLDYCSRGERKANNE